MHILHALALYLSPFLAPHYQRMKPNLHFPLLPKQIIAAALVFVAMICATSESSAQVGVQLSLSKKNYLLNEPVIATIQISNQTGSELKISGSANSSWLTFNITVDGKIISQSARVNYNAVTIPVGQSLTREVDLSRSYPLALRGRYACEAFIELDGQRRNAVSSNRMTFKVDSGRTAWSARAGVPGSNGEIREYRLVNFTVNNSLMLFAEVRSVSTDEHLSTIALTGALNFRRPHGVIDKRNTMHVLYQIRPEIFTHVNISLDCKVLSSSYIKRAGGTPTLTKLGDGSVIVTGGVAYDHTKAAAERKRVHDASERPSSIFR